jgi:lipopolysaccharide transport system permease protein
MYILLLPLIILQMAVLGLGLGILISSLTTKYKDLTFVMSFFVQLWMYATPIVYPLSIVPEKYRLLVILNPMASIVETFRGAFLGVSSIELSHIIISVSFTLLIFFLGLLMFNRVEKSFMDTI